MPHLLAMKEVENRYQRATGISRARHARSLEDLYAQVSAAHPSVASRKEVLISKLAQECRNAEGSASASRWALVAIVVAPAYLGILFLLHPMIQWLRSRVPTTFSIVNFFDGQPPSTKLEVVAVLGTILALLLLPYLTTLARIILGAFIGLVPHTGLRRYLSGSVESCLSLAEKIEKGSRYLCLVLGAHYFSFAGAMLIYYRYIPAPDPARGIIIGTWFLLPIFLLCLAPPYLLMRKVFSPYKIYIRHVNKGYICKQISLIIDHVDKLEPDASARTFLVNREDRRDLQAALRHTARCIRSMGPGYATVAREFRSRANSLDRPDEDFRRNLDRLLCDNLNMFLTGFQPCRGSRRSKQKRKAPVGQSGTSTPSSQRSLRRLSVWLYMTLPVLSLFWLFWLLFRPGPLLFGLAASVVFLVWCFLGKVLFESDTDPATFIGQITHSAKIPIDFVKNLSDLLKHLGK